jgi:hypothetical protein
MNLINDKFWNFYKFFLNKNGYVIIDNFLKDNISEHLRNYMLQNEDFNKTYLDYKAADIRNIPQLTEELSKISILKNKEFLRSWAFIYDNNARGVMPHADPASINVNIWVTPNECILDKKKNGLVIWADEPPSDWSWVDYNQNHQKIENFLKDKKPVEIKYRYNRAIFFKSKYFHSTDYVSTKLGHENKRINYTFLFK